MAHPYKNHVHKSHKSKKGGMLKNDVLPVMHAVGENRKEGAQGSMQHMKQSSASGYKRGGRIPRSVSGIISRPPMAMKRAVLAGAGHDASTAPASLKRYPIKAGIDSGVGRLQYSRAQRKKK